LKYATFQANLQNPGITVADKSTKRPYHIAKAIGGKAPARGAIKTPNKKKDILHCCVQTKMNCIYTIVSQQITSRKQFQIVRDKHPSSLPQTPIISSFLWL
jgi:hypothetical protein